jgi:hypothetical protein|tara:strand:+ start:890 stop:1231 length:342 start_codon:yes stop_codon:yes gene_type:complete
MFGLLRNSGKYFAVLAVSAIFCVTGIKDSHAEDALISQIETFASSYCPKDFIATNGAELPIQSYPALFSLIGNRFGGDGVRTFKLPKITNLTDDNKIKLTSCIAVNGNYPTRP